MEKDKTCETKIRFFPIDGKLICGHRFFKIPCDECKELVWVSVQTLHLANLTDHYACWECQELPKKSLNVGRHHSGDLHFDD